MNRVAESVSADKEVAKEVKRMAEYLKGLDGSPDEPLAAEQANLLLGNTLFQSFVILIRGSRANF